MISFGILIIYQTRTFTYIVCVPCLPFIGLSLMA